MDSPDHQIGPQPQQAGRYGGNALLNWALRILGIALVVYVAARLSQHLTVPPSNASPVWPGAGIALGVTLLYGPRALLGVFLGVAVFEFHLFAGPDGGGHVRAIGLAVGLALGACLQAFVGARLTRIPGEALPRLIGDAGILRFQLLGGPVACVVSATGGMTFLWFAGVVPTTGLVEGWLTWWVGDSIGALIFAPLVLIAVQRGDPLWRSRRYSVALPMLGLFLAAMAFYSYSSAQEMDELRSRFNDETRAQHSTFVREFDSYLGTLDFLASYFDAEKRVSASEFHAMTRRALATHPGIQALEWIPRVTAQERADFERGLSAVGQVRRLGRGGSLYPAEEREEYYVIAYAEPAESNASVFGYDVTSNPAAAEALFRARDTGRTAATGGFRLAQETGDDIGVVFYSPVYRPYTPPDRAGRRQTIVGVVAAVLRMGTLVGTELSRLRHGTIATRVLDVTGEGEPSVLYASHADIIPADARLTDAMDLNMAGRAWRLEFTALPGFTTANTTWTVWVVLTGGLLITVLFGTGLLMLTGRTLGMENEVVARTLELRAEVDQRRATETQLRLVLEGANLGFWDWDYKSDRQWVNDRWLQILGLQRDELRNHTSDFQDRIHPDEKDSVLASIARHIADDTGYVIDFRMRHRDGHWVWIQASGAVVSHDPVSGAPLRLCGTHQDITELHEQHEHILRQAHYDTLTALPNRFLALDRLNQLINDAARNREAVAVLFLDLDDFKKINDTLGHDTGDKLLQQAAARLQEGIRRGDTVGRLGGDEFIVLLGGIGEADAARPVAESLLRRFDAAFRIDGRELVLTVSIGIAVYPADGGNTSTLLRNADSAMYHSKALGRNIYSYFTGEMNRGVTRRLQLEEQMHGALQRGEFRVWYQPQVSIADGSVVGAEALLRWSNPVLGDLAPGEFIPIAEQTGLIVQIGKFVLREALVQVGDWRETLGPDFKIAVNLSPRQFRDPELVNFVAAALRHSDVPPAALELEITEGVLMSGHAVVDAELSALNDLGVSIAMDDFGTGYSSLSYLRSYPFDVLKIDREFIDGITDDLADRELVNAAIAMAHGLGLKVIAEGVETKAQFHVLSLLRCDFGQGYFFGRPQPAGDVTPLLAAGLPLDPRQ